MSFEKPKTITIGAKEVHYPLYSLDFLDRLADRSKDIDLLEFLINVQGKSFPEAIETIADYLKMTIEYHPNTRKGERE